MAGPLAVLAIPAALQAGIGIAQGIKGLSMNPERPEYEIPESATEALANAKYVASQTGLPGADIFRSALRENMANSVFNLTQAASSPTQILAGVEKMNQEYANQEQELAMKSAQNYLNNQGVLRSELGAMAAREDQAFIANEYNPWLMDMERKQSLLEGSATNIIGGATGLANLAGDKAELDFLRELYGKDKKKQNESQKPGTVTRNYGGVQERNWFDRPTGINPAGSSTSNFQAPQNPYSTPSQPYGAGQQITNLKPLNPFDVNSNPFDVKVNFNPFGT
jgi:hypothetical protein